MRRTVLAALGWTDSANYNDSRSIANPRAPSESQTRGRPCDLKAGMAKLLAARAA
jgi:hypothetical protein